MFQINILKGAANTISQIKLYLTDFAFRCKLEMLHLYHQTLTIYTNLVGKTDSEPHENDFNNIFISIFSYKTIPS